MASWAATSGAGATGRLMPMDTIKARLVALEPAKREVDWEGQRDAICQLAAHVQRDGVATVMPPAFQRECVRALLDACCSERSALAARACAALCDMVMTGGRDMKDLVDRTLHPLIKHTGTGNKTNAARVLTTVLTMVRACPTVLTVSETWRARTDYAANMVVQETCFRIVNTVLALWSDDAMARVAKDYTSDLCKLLLAGVQAGGELARRISRVNFRLFAARYPAAAAAFEARCESKLPGWWSTLNDPARVAEDTAKLASDGHVHCTVLVPFTPAATPSHGVVVAWADGTPTPSAAVEAVVVASPPRPRAGAGTSMTATPASRPTSPTPSSAAVLDARRQRPTSPRHLTSGATSSMGVPPRTLGPTPALAGGPGRSTTHTMRTYVADMQAGGHPPPPSPATATARSFPRTVTPPTSPAPSTMEGVAPLPLSPTLSEASTRVHSPTAPVRVVATSAASATPSTMPASPAPSRSRNGTGAASQWAPSSAPAVPPAAITARRAAAGGGAVRHGSPMKGGPEGRADSPRSPAMMYAVPPHTAVGAVAYDIHARLRLHVNEAVKQYSSLLKTQVCTQLSAAIVAATQKRLTAAAATATSDPHSQEAGMLMGAEGEGGGVVGGPIIPDFPSDSLYHLTDDIIAQAANLRGQLDELVARAKAARMYAASVMEDPTRG